MEIEIVSDTARELRAAVSGALRRPDNEVKDPLIRSLSGNRARRVVLDLASVASMDSGAIHWLLATQRSLRIAGGDLVLRAAPPCVDGPLRLLDLHRVLIEPEPAGAAASRAVGGAA